MHIISFFLLSISFFSFFLFYCHLPGIISDECQLNLKLWMLNFVSVFCKYSARHFKSDIKEVTTFDSQKVVLKSGMSSTTEKCSIWFVSYCISTTHLNNTNIIECVNVSYQNVWWMTYKLIFHHIILNVLCPMSNDQCPLSNVQCLVIYIPWLSIL